MQLPFALAAIALLADSNVIANPLAQYGKPGRAPACPAEKCFSSIRLKPSVAKVASAFCSKYINYQPAVKTTTVKTTSISTYTTTSTITPDKVTSTDTTTVSPTPATLSPTCTTVTSTSTGTVTTNVLFPSQGGDGNLKKRAAATVPSVLGAGCGSGKAFTSKISSACSCYLGPAKQTKTSTSTSTILSTITVTVSTTQAAVTTVTASTTLDPVTDCQTATTTVNETSGGFTCGAAPLATAYGIGGRISCTGPAPAGETPIHFRIEGNAAEGTTFDSCLNTGPRVVTTPSGGTHRCDGTNGNANPTPGGTPTTAIDDVARMDGFDYDGTYSNTFSDYFIQRIRQTAQTSNQFWGILDRLVFTPSGGCQYQAGAGTEILWAFDAFNANAFLDLVNQYAVVQPGESVSVIIQQNDGNGNTSPAGGATMAGSTSDRNGNLRFAAPFTEGCYQYKAERNGAIRSQTFYLSVRASLT